MRRVFAGVIAGLVGMPVFFFLRVNSEEGLLSWLLLTGGTYAFIEWLGLIPPALSHRTPNLLRDDEQPTDKSHEGRAVSPGRSFVLFLIGLVVLIVLGFLVLSTGLLQPPM